MGHDPHVRLGQVAAPSSSEGMGEFVTRVWIGRYADTPISELRNERFKLDNALAQATRDRDLAAMDRLRLQIRAAEILIRHKERPDHDRLVMPAETIRARKLKVRRVNPIIERARRQEIENERAWEQAQKEAIERKRARKIMHEAIADEVAHDPATTQARQLHDSYLTSANELRQKIAQAENPNFQRYVTDEELKRGVSETLEKMRNLQLLMVDIEKKYHVSMEDSQDMWDFVAKTEAGANWGLSDGQNMDAVNDAVRFMATRRLGQTLRKYGLAGRQPLRPKGAPEKRFSQEEMARDMAAILGDSRQSQMMGIDDPGGGAFGNLGARMADISDRQDLEDINRAGANLSKDQLADKTRSLFGRERQGQLLGADGPGSENRRALEQKIDDKMKEFDRRYRLEQVPKLRSYLTSQMNGGTAASPAEIEAFINNYVNGATGAGFFGN